LHYSVFPFIKSTLIREKLVFTTHRAVDKCFISLLGKVTFPVLPGSYIPYSTEAWGACWERFGPKLFWWTV